MKNLIAKTVPLICLLLTTPAAFGDSVIENPSKRVINLPISIDEDGNIDAKLPSGPAKHPPRVIASCQLPDLQIRVLKEYGQKRAHIRQLKDGQESQRVVPYVVTQKLTKDMLGQYAAAVVIAQQLGITEVDYVKIMLVDPQMKLEDSKALVFFYDSDDDVIDRTLVANKQWVRCLDE